MSRCRKCNIEILDETEHCPLCHSVLEQTEELENMYPNVVITARKMALIARVYLFGAILLEALFVVINATGDFQTWWSVIVGLGFLYGYLVIRFAILGKAGYKSKVMVLALIAVLLAVISDFLVGYNGWSVTYALPIVIVCLDAIIVALMIVNRRNWQSYMMWQIMMIFFSVISLEFSVKGISSAPLWGELAFGASTALFLGTLIIGGRRARTELKRRFHIRYWISMKKNKTSIRGKMMRKTIARVTSSHLIGSKFKNGDMRKNIGAHEVNWKCPDCFLWRQIDMGHFRMELLESKGNPRKDRILMQIHGGGYIAGMQNDYRMLAGLYSEIGQKISVLSVDYRVAPEYPYPAALLDVYEAYRWLLTQGWRGEQIVLAGDSAGGGLAMALCHYLKDNGEAMPCGIIAMSPWTDLSVSGESYDTNYEKDPLFGNTRESLLYKNDYIGENDPKNAYISPLFGDFSGFPPMLLQVGSYEMLLSDSVEVAKKAKAQGVKVRLSIYDGMFHVFQKSVKLLPESKRAWAEIGRFIRVLTNA